MHGDSIANEPRDGAVVDENTEQSPAKDAVANSQGTAGGVSEAVAQAQAEAGRLKEAWLRTAADFDNYKKRSRRELDDARRGGREDLVKALLPVFDNLERALQSALRSSDVKAMTDGLSMVQRQFTDALGREGISRVPTVGHAFDPSVHEAIQQVETDEHPVGTVIAEVQSGYSQGERLLRAAMVVVARGRTMPSNDTQSGDATN